MQSEFATDASRRPSEPRPLLARIPVDSYVGFLILAPLYLLLASSNWIFSPLDYIDPWVYHGYFRNLVEYKTAFFPNTYYGSRLSWILPGHAAYSLLPPLAANYALHLGLWYAAVFALYSALKNTVGRQTALIACVFLGSLTHFLQAVGSDYVDGPAIVYYLLGFAFLTAAACNPPGRFALVLAGVFYAAVVYANIFTIVFAPVVMFYFALLAWRSEPGHSIRRAIAALACFLGGAAALTLFLGCVNFLIEGSFAFYMPSVYYVLGNVGQPNAWKLPVEQWITRAEWLVLPLAVAVASLLALLSRRFRQSTLGPAAAGAFLLAFAVMIFCEGKGIPVLQQTYYASYLIPPAFLAIGALLERPLQQLSVTAALLMAIAVLLVVSAPQWGDNGQWTHYKMAVWPLAPLLLGAAFAICALLRGRIAAWGMVAALAGCLLTSTSVGYAFAGRHAVHDAFARVTRAAAAIDAVRGDEFIRFWYGKADPHFVEFNALNSIYLWGYTLIGNEFPAIRPDAAVVDGSLLVIPSSKEEILLSANEALHPGIFAADLVERREIFTDAVSYSLWFVRLKFDSGRLEPLQLRPCASGSCAELIDRARSAPALLPPDRWTPSPDPRTRFEKTPQGVSLTTSLNQEAQVAKYGPLVAATDGNYVFKLQYVIDYGGIAFGVKSEDESRWLAQATIPLSQPGERTAVLSVEAAAGEAFWLVISNDHPIGHHASRYLILELEAYRFPAGETAPQTRPTKR